jgi:hypothetical protein
MRKVRTLLIAAALSPALAGATPAFAFAQPGFNTPAPIQHVQEARYADAQAAPYAMNYADDAARTLGVKDGHWQAIESSGADPLLPSVGGGLDSGRPMLRLQWR